MQEYDSRIPPNNLEAERAVLGAALIERDALIYAVDALKPEDFYEPRHAAAFGVMVEMAEMDKAVDHITFREELSRRGVLERIGGFPFVMDLVDCVTTAANVEHHCGIVRDKAIRRGMIKAGAEIAKLGFAEDVDSNDALSDAEQKMFEVAGRGGTASFKAIRDVVAEYHLMLEKSITEGPSMNGVPSGFADFDRLTGGFQPGSLNIIAARPSMGKTALALNIAQHAAIRSDANVLLFSLEMSVEQLYGRLLSAESGVSMKEILQTGKVDSEQWTKIADAAGRLSAAQIYIDDGSDLQTFDLRAKCRRFFSEHRDEKALVIVDYLQLMRSSRKAENRQQEVSDISRSLKAVAREFDVPVIALSQLSRDVEKRGSDKRPMLSDLRDSGAIEQDADIVAFLYRKAYYQQDGEDADPTAELSLAKHRNGPTGKVDLVFCRDISRFESMAYYSQN